MQHNSSALVNEQDIRIGLNGDAIDGTLAMPPHARALILFAHGSGSSRFSPRNRAVAEFLHDDGFATLLMDLLTSDEERADNYTREHRFNIELLARRVVGAIDWAHTNPRTQELPIGLFGASTGAAATLAATAERPDRVGAVVSRGGRPDLAGPMLERVQAPTLLIVGAYDDIVIDLNREAMESMNGVKHIAIVPGATHLFEEPGALEKVCALAGDWFTRYLTASSG